ncbi:MAG TPA: hypothetical protein PKJ33_02935 [Alphaproteobacteria bacterium]|nr:hypothetical protein [Alphaproteobacteria bacterium]
MADVKIVDLQDYLRAIFKAHHLDMMDPWRKAQYAKLRGKNDSYIAEAGSTIPHDDKEPIYHKEVDGKVYPLGKDISKVQEPGKLFYYKYENGVPEKIYVDGPKSESEYQINAKGEKVFAKDNRSSTQKKWENKATGELATEWPENMNPPLDMSDEDWELFYRICRKTFRGIFRNKKELERKLPPGEPMVAGQFIGSEPFKTFKVATLSPETIKIVEGLIHLIENDSLLKMRLTKDAYGSGTVFNETYSINSFISDLKSGKAQSDQKVQGKLSEVLTTINTLMNVNENFANREDLSSGDKLKNKFGDSLKIAAAIEDVNNDKDDPPSPSQLAMFRHGGVYKEILKKLYDPRKENREGAFFSQFRDYNGSVITSVMTEQVSESNYLTGDSAIQPLFEEQLNVIETIKDKWGDWKDEHLARFWDRSSRHIYIENGAEPIITAIGKEKISPVKGILQLVDKKKELRDRIQKTAPGSLDGFDFLVRALEHIKGGAKSDKMLEGALRNGKKARALAMEIMKFGMSETTDRAKAADIKAALEVLAVMRYDTFSSAHGAELWKVKADIFKDASFMKQEGVKFVLNAAEGAVKLGLNGLYWAGVMLRNKIQHNRAKINSPKSAEENAILEKALKQINEQSKDFRDPDEALKELEERQKAFDDYESKHKELLEKHEIYKRLQDEIENKKMDLGSAGQLAKDILRKEEIKKLLEEQLNKIADLDKEIKKKEKETKAIEKRIKKIKEDIDAAGSIPKNHTLYAELKVQVKQLDDKNKEIKNINSEKNKIINPKLKGAAREAKVLAYVGEKQKEIYYNTNRTAPEGGDLPSQQGMFSKYTLDAIRNMPLNEILDTFGIEGLQIEYNTLNSNINSADNLRKNLNPKALSIEESSRRVLLDDYNDLAKLFGYEIDLATSNVGGKLTKVPPTPEQLANQKIIKDWVQLDAEVNVAKELYTRIKGIKNRGENSATAEKPQNPEKSKEDQMEMLLEFWNAVNGFNEDYDVNSFWSLRNIETVRKEKVLSAKWQAEHPWQND